MANEITTQSTSGASGLTFSINSISEAKEFANAMANSVMVPKHLRQKPNDCLAVLIQALRWQLDPFSVAQKTYFVNDGMGYEAQLVNGLILSHAPLQGRPKLIWSGEGDKMKCQVSATFIGESEPSVFEAEIATITTKNSPLWKQQPKQQLGYFALRAWARLYCPDILMGIYTKEEREEFTPIKDVTPKQHKAEDATVIDAETGEIVESVPQYTPKQLDKVRDDIIKAVALIADFDGITAMLEGERLAKLKALSEPRYDEIVAALTAKQNELKGANDDHHEDSNSVV